MLIFSKNLLFLLLIFSVFSSECFAKGNAEKAEKGMVVSASSLASYAGVQILRKGGNAVDAAVAVGFMLAVTYPSAGNIGGGGFMVIHTENGLNTTLDYREKAPQSASESMYLDEEGNYKEELSRSGYTSSGIPGSVAGLLYALEKYGTLSLEDVILPAIQVAENGFRIGYKMAESINYYNNEFKKYTSSKDVFTVEGDSLPDNHLLVQKDLANTLRRILEDGREGFYSGKTAQLLVEHVRSLGGDITYSDLENYKVVERAPIMGNYKGKTIISMPPPSSGGIALLESLNTLTHFNFNLDEWGSSRYIHTVVEILKRVYADRNFHVGDPDFYDVPVDCLVSEERATEIAKSIGNVAIPSEEIEHSDIEIIESPETTHYSIIDSKGNAVSVTTTINSSYGNKIVVEGAGFLMNNEMDDFSAKPGVPNQYGLVGSKANSIQPGKRMLSSMTPTIILEDGSPYLVLGSPGGSTIITSVLQVVLNCIDFNMNIYDAIDAPRFHHQHLPDKIYYENFGLALDVINNLKRIGHHMGEKTDLGRVEGIQIDQNGIMWGVSDPRGYGKAAGY